MLHGQRCLKINSLSLSLAIVIVLDVWHFLSCGHVSVTWQLPLLYAFPLLYSLVNIALLCFDTICFHVWHASVTCFDCVSVEYFGILCSLCVRDACVKQI